MKADVYGQCQGYVSACIMTLTATESVFDNPNGISHSVPTEIETTEINHLDVVLQQRDDKGYSFHDWELLSMRMQSSERLGSQRVFPS
jgi:hypothetical protein